MKKAFTLIELLVVIAIIAILAALLMPALVKARVEAQKVQCASNVHNLGLGWSMFRKDFDGMWTREQCVAWGNYPEIIADIGGLGYLKDNDVYLCPSLDSPYERNPAPIFWYAEVETDPSGDVMRSTGEISGNTYFADEARIAREPLENRAILADGIEMMTTFGPEPANHADDKGRAEGSNVLFVDMAVEWTGIYRAEHAWSLDTYESAQSSDGIWPDTVNSYGFSTGDPWGYNATAGTWKRYGYIQNVRLLRRAEGEIFLGGGAGVGEDDNENQGTFDVDDIYYADCTTERYGADGPWAFVTFTRHARCVSNASRSVRDCSLAGGHLWWWRLRDDGYGGTGTWGWPTEIKE